MTAPHLDTTASVVEDKVVLNQSPPAIHIGLLFSVCIQQNSITIVKNSSLLTATSWMILDCQPVSADLVARDEHLTHTRRPP